MCGGSSLDCSSKCGSSLCEDKCGYFNASQADEENECSQGLNSLVKHHSHLVKEYKKLFESKEAQFKKMLSRVSPVKNALSSHQSPTDHSIFQSSTRPSWAPRRLTITWPS